MDCRQVCLSDMDRRQVCLSDMDCRQVCLSDMDRRQVCLSDAEASRPQEVRATTVNYSYESSSGRNCKFIMSDYQ